MIKAIDMILCTGCGLCEKICPADIFRMDEEKRKMTLAYQADCCNCLQCKYICPVDAVSFSPAEPKKINMNNEWAQIKEIMGVTDNPMAAETKKPAWQRAKEAAMKKAGAGGWK